MLNKQLFIKNWITLLFISVLPFGLVAQEPSAAEPAINLPKLPTTWDEGLPLGNGMQGALIWQKENAVRFSLDRADLWDERLIKNFDRSEFSFEWVKRQWLGNNYKKVQELFDEPYSKEAGPTKIPGAALEIAAPANWGETSAATVNVFKALATVQYTSGVRIQSFVAATIPYGFFRIQNAKTLPVFRLVPPAYGPKTGDVPANDLSKLGYKQGKVDSIPNGYTYLQEGYNGFKYRVTVVISRQKNGTIEGIWNITSGTSATKGIDKADLISPNAYLGQGFDFYLTQHAKWWDNYWAKSDIQIPEKTLKRHWQLAQYFLGSTSRAGGPPISLQAIWTADNGKLPPWKGDFHHDLNTQMSYWPAYAANHLEESIIFPDYLDARKDIFKTYTKKYFGKDGLNVPGVSTLAGSPMGGWIQYALSPTTSAWLAQHYYWQWKYSNDREFLRLRGYPWVKETATFLEKLMEKDSKGKLKLPISSSPEINDNTPKAWFAETTNYDLSLIQFTWKTAAIMATALGNASEAARWEALLESLPPLSLATGMELNIAPGVSLTTSHRHFSHLMAIYPLGLLHWEQNDTSRQIIRRSIQVLDSLGTKQWNGYSFGWQAALKARARDGEGAEKALQIFAEAFCGANGFHLNGDATKKYAAGGGRPFTLEGNFGFAAGLQEMLIQSHSDTVVIMPAVPQSWLAVSFKNLRTEGGMLVSGIREEGKMKQVVVTADTDGFIYLKIPYPNYSNRVVPLVGKPAKKTIVNGVMRLYLTKGSVVEINPTKWPYK
jgi:alpha-L-fucosidase 2